MISGLVNFLVMLFYHGNYPANITWVLFFYTMGAVAIARVAIEQTRAYAHGYAAILGIAGFFVMSGYFGSLLFTVFILFTISYLADRIVHDCTLIDETVDASGQGLVDFGKEFVQTQVNQLNEARLSDQRQPSSETDSPPASPQPRRPRKTHQPGRTVMWLALAALPLFGLGQFMLRDDPASWDRAKYLLAIYLFASLSLLVTTSFLGLRRYLRQRGADMPGDVSIGWIAGGILSILLILIVAYAAPVPGQLLASFTLPDFLDPPRDKQASRYGWGDEGAQRQSDDDAVSRQSDAQDDAPPSGESQAGAKPGEADHGNAKNAPTGQDPGGKKSGGKKSASEKSAGEKSAGEKSAGKQPASEQPAPSDQSQPDNQPQPTNNSQKKQEKNSDNQQPPPASEQKQNDDKSNDDASENSDRDKQQDERQLDDDQQPRDETKQNQRDAKQASKPPETSRDQRPSEHRSWSPSTSLSALSGIVRWIIMLGLVAIIAFYVWRNWEALVQWWQSLFGFPAAPTEAQQRDILPPSREAPLRPFSSFTNPVGRENDPRRVVVITFQAFEAWAREQGWQRNKDETPSEFLKRTSTAIPHAAQPASQIVDAYNRIVFGRGKATSADMRAVNLIWSVMTQSLSPTA